MVERGVRRENAVLALLRVFTCLLAPVDAHHGERHALNLDVAPQDLLLPVKQQLPHALADHGHLAAIFQVALVDVTPLHDDNGVDVLVHGHVAVDPACCGLQPVGDVVAAPPASELVPRRHGLQRGRVFFQERHVHGGQFNATPPGISLVREAGRLAPQERAVLDAVAHVGFDAFLQAVGRPHRDEDHEEPPAHAQRTQQRAERVAQKHLRQLQPRISLPPPHSSRSASTGRMATALKAGPNPLANPTSTKTTNANNAMRWST